MLSEYIIRRLRWFLVILIILISLIFLLNSFPKNSKNTTQKISAQCPTTLQQCGAGCIPKNAECQDRDGINGFCLRPIDGSTNGSCYTCPQGQAFCGMGGFCYDIGRKCCFGGVCPVEASVASSAPQEVKDKNNITLTSVPNIICIFEKSSLWSSQVPWDGSYICRTSITIDLHGLTFSEKRTLKLNINPAPDYANFSDFEALPDVPINEITFNYSQVGGDYFQEEKPSCPATGLNGRLNLFEAIPDIENPFFTQYFDINIPASCR